jgi:hypothetical protein
MVYLVRERGHFWDSAPSRWMIVSSTVDVSVVCLLSARGILMAPLPDSLIGSARLACVLCPLPDRTGLFESPNFAASNVYVVSFIRSASAS